MDNTRLAQARRAALSSLDLLKLSLGTTMSHTTTNHRDLDTLPVSKLFWQYTIPSLAGMLATGLYVVIDGTFVGHFVGSHGLAAIALAYPLVMMQVGLGAMLSMGAATRIAILQGGGDYERARATLVAALALLALISLAIPLLGLTYLDTLLQWLQADKQPIVMAEARNYLQWMLGGALFTMGQMVATYLLRNDGRPRLATLLMVIGSLLNVVFNYLFVGVLKLGLAGSAQATLLSESVVMLAGLGYFFTRHARLRLRLANWQLDWRCCGPVLALGLSSLLMEFNLALLMFAHNFQLLRWGTDLSVAAYATAGYSEALFTLVVHGLAVGLQPLLSHSTGAGRPERTREALRYGLRVTMLLGLTALAAVQLFPTLIVRMYNSEDLALIAAGSHALRLHLLAMPFDGLVIIGIIALQAMALTRAALLLTIGKTILLLPALWLLPLWLKLDGVWLAMPLVNLLLGTAAALALWGAFQRLKRQENLATAT